MITLSKEIIRFFQDQGFVILSTIDNNGIPHSSCKDIVDIDADGKVYLLDAYRAKTFANLKNNQNACITVVDEHKFKGFCLKGKARVTDVNELDPKILKVWEDRITNRMTSRVLKNIRGERGHAKHPEVQLPKPQCMICIEVDEIVNLTPHKLR